MLNVVSYRIFPWRIKLLFIPPENLLGAGLPGLHAKNPFGGIRVKRRSELPAHLGAHVMGGVINSPHLGGIVQLELEVFLGQEVDIGSHHRKVPVGGVGDEGEVAALLAEAGAQPPAALGVLVLLGGVDLGHHRHRVPLQGGGHLGLHSGLQRAGVLGRDIQIEGSGAAFGETVRSGPGVGQGHRRGYHQPLQLQVVALLLISVELVVSG
jgi:hypothetical protein